MPTRARQEPASISGTPGQVRRQGSQEPAHRLGVNSSQWGVGSYLLCPFPSPLPESPAQGTEGVPTCWRSFHPTPVPILGGCVGLVTEGGPQRSFVPPDPPPPQLLFPGAGKTPGFLECRGPTSSDPSQMPWPLIPRAHASGAEQGQAGNWIML